MNEDNNSTLNFVYAPFIILGTVAFILILILSVNIGNTLQDYYSLKDSPCQPLVITDKFSDLQGGISSYTRYYVVDENKTPRWLFSTGNVTQVYTWNTIEKGKSYDMKIYKEYVEFC
jgi:hypothetical protein